MPEYQEISLLPIDVGFDPKLLAEGVIISLDNGMRIRCHYENERGNPSTITAEYYRLRQILTENGFQKIHFSQTCKRCGKPIEEDYIGFSDGECISCCMRYFVREEAVVCKKCGETYPAGETIDGKCIFCE